MQSVYRGVLFCFGVALFSYACADSGLGPTNPTGPSSVVIPLQTLNWECGRQGANATTLGGWSFEQPASSCPSALSTTLNAGAAIAVAPGNFRATVSGRTVRLDWDPVPEAVSHRLEAGSAAGLANLAVFNTGTAATTLIVANVPPGVYYARVRAVGTDNQPGPASNEIVVGVGSCSGPPVPSNLSAQVSGNQVNLSWTSGGGNAASSHIIEAGSAPGLANLVVFDTGNASQSLGAVAPNGVFYVRVRGRNSCGIGGPSNEVIVRVPGGTTEDPPWTPPTGPEPPGPPPPVTTLVPEINVSVPVAEPPRAVTGPPPRPDAGVGPPVDVTVISSPTPTTRRVLVVSSRAVDRIVFAADTRSASLSVGSGTMAVAESYYLIRLASPQTSVELTLTVAQSFTGQVAASQGEGPVGAYKAVPLTSSLGTGAFRATLTWNTTADMDLHVIEPDGTHVYFGAPTGRTASLDVDDRNGFGPENIFVPTGGATSGIYQVYIHHYSGASPTTSTITITVNAGTAQARSATYTRTTTNAAPTMNVANVNVATGEIIPVASARLSTDINVRRPKTP